MRRLRTRLGFCVGFAVAFIVLVAIGEGGLRLATPREVQPYLSTDLRPGPFRSDPVYGVQYKSWAAFQADYADALRTYDELFVTNDPPKTWAMFGSSFVQAPDMLADTTRKLVPGRRVFNLGRNEFVHVRAAQIDLLLENGLRPERIVFVLMPLDIAELARHSFAMVHAGNGGAMAFTPRLPPVGAWLIEHSRLALTGWVRAEMQHHIPFFKHTEMTRRMDERMLRETDHLLRSIAAVAKRHSVPVTVLLIPNWEQINKSARFAFQDSVTALAQSAGFDVCDPRAAFVNHGDKPALFIPDKHFSDLGNRLLLAELVQHLHAIGAAQDVKLPEGPPG